MHIYCFLKRKITIQKGPLFTIFKRSSLIHKNNPLLVASIVLKKSTSTVFVRFLKNTFNFTRSCAFAQKAKFYALKMLKNKISRILKLPSWQHWGGGSCMPRAPPGGGRQNHVKDFFLIYILRNYKKSDRIQ